MTKPDLYFRIFSGVLAIILLASLYFLPLNGDQRSYVGVGCSVLLLGSIVFMKKFHPEVFERRGKKKER